MYKGIIKVVYDRGFALQSKAVLVESITTVAQVVQHATQALNLAGTPDDYALEERDILAGSKCVSACLCVHAHVHVLVCAHMCVGVGTNKLILFLQQADYCP